MPADPRLRSRSASLPASDHTPNLLLVVSAQSRTLTDGRWQFVIETAGGRPVLEADDAELGDINRLTLLATVRGLESLDGAANITLLSHNRYLIRSLTDSLPRWRRSDFVWDHFGRRVEVQHADLWRRIDRTLSIHDVAATLVTTRRLSPSRRHGRAATVGSTQPPSAVSSQSATDQPTGDKSFIRIDAAHQGADAMSHRRLRNWLLRSSQAGIARVPNSGKCSPDPVTT
ncbi:MAG: ribonuclease HI [Planctomycetota bacterium]